MGRNTLVHSAHRLALALALVWHAPLVLANGWEHTAIPVETLISALDDPDALVRARAAHSLGHHSKEVATNALIKTLEEGEPDPGVRQAIFSSLGKAADSAALGVIAHCLGSETVIAVRTACAEALGGMEGDQALEQAQSAINDPAPPVRLAAIRSLGYIGGDQAAQTLQGLLDESERFSTAAIRALGHTAHQSAVAPVARFVDVTLPATTLVPALKSLTQLNGKSAIAKIEHVYNETKDDRVKRFALIALGTMSSEVGRFGLSDSLTSSDPLMRIQALEIIRELKDPVLLKATIKAGTEFAKGFFEKDIEDLRVDADKTVVELAILNEFLRTVIAIDPHHADSMFAISGRDILFTPTSPTDLHIAEGLYKARWQSIYGAGYTHIGANDLIIRDGFADSDSRLRAVAVRAMGVNNPQRFRAEVLEGLTDPSPEVRRQSAIVLGRFGDPDNLDPLIDATADSHNMVRLEAIRSLGYLGLLEARVVLQDIHKNDADPRIRESAFNSLSLLNK